MKTLIVEDDFASRLVLQIFLSRYGECNVAVNGKDAVNAVRVAREDGQKYDLVCMDLMMPGMDGQTAVRAIRRDEATAGFTSKQVTIIITSALGDVDNVSAAFQGMCAAYLKKPINLARLSEELKTLRLV